MKQPNILFIFTDQHRHDMLSFAGSPYVHTPNIDQIARRGCRFTHVYCTTPLCMPSRTTYFTGRDAARNGHFENTIILGRDDDHLLTRLREAGYQLCLAGKNHAFKDDELEAWDFVELYGVKGKEEKPYCSPPTEQERAVIDWRMDAIPYFESAIHEPQPGPEEADPAHAQTSHAIRFLHEQRDSQRPFFLWLSFEAPHFPYVLPETRFSQTRPQDMPGLMDEHLWKHGPSRLELQHAGLQMDRMDDQDIRRIQATYCGMIEFVDAQVGRMLQTLKEIGLDDNTIIIFASDHGDFWGHRGLVGKTNAVYEDLIRIPTIWHVPGAQEGVVSDALIQNLDFTPTLLDILNLGPLQDSQGLSYRHVLETPQLGHRSHIVAESSLGLPAFSTDEIREDISSREHLLQTQGEAWFLQKLGGMTRSSYSPPYKLITHETDAPELYHLGDDPQETRNLFPKQ